MTIDANRFQKSHILIDQASTEDDFAKFVLDRRARHLCHTIDVILSEGFPTAKTVRASLNVARMETSFIVDEVLKADGTLLWSYSKHPEAEEAANTAVDYANDILMSDHFLPDLWFPKDEPVDGGIGIVITLHTTNVTQVGGLNEGIPFDALTDSDLLAIRDDASNHLGAAGKTPDLTDVEHHLTEGARDAGIPRQTIRNLERKYGTREDALAAVVQTDAWRSFGGQIDDYIAGQVEQVVHWAANEALEG